LPDPKKWTTVKVPKETYDALKRMGMGIGKAIEVLVKSQQQRLEQRLGEIEEAGRDIADILIKSGFFNIKLLGGKVTEVSEEGSRLTISGYLVVDVPNEDVRKRIIERLRRDVQV